MNIIPAYRDFSVGEISPLLRDRHDVDTHGAAVAIMRNMVPDAHGPAKSRDGTEHLNTISGETSGVIKTFQTASNKYFLIIFTPLLASAFDNDGVPNPVAYQWVVPYTSDELKDIHTVLDPNRTTLWVFHKNHPTVQFTILPFLPNRIFYSTPPLSWVAPPAYWGSAAGTYPATGTIHAGKLWMANGGILWASKPQDRLNLTTGTTEADGFEVEMEDAGEIRWLSRSQDLVVGTDFGEYIITSQGPVIYIGDIAIDLQSGYGSKSIQPFILGDKLGFISGDGRKLYATQYDRSTQTWIPTDVSFFSEHITEGDIKDFTYHPHPDNLAWFAKNDGDFISALYNRSVNVYGWSRHDTNGIVESISGGKINGVGEVVSLVNRNGSDLFLELSKPIQLDSHVHYTGASTDTITGLGHLEGMTVRAKAEGYYAGEYTVSGGQIILDQETDDVYVGLAFEQELELLPIDEGSQRGSGRTHLKRYKDIFVGILDSYLPEINGQTPPDIAADELMDTAPELITGLVNITDMGYDRESPVNIKQSLPFPLIVTGVFGTLTQEKL